LVISGDGCAARGSGARDSLWFNAAGSASQCVLREVLARNADGSNGSLGRWPGRSLGTHALRTGEPSMGLGRGISFSSSVPSYRVEFWAKSTSAKRIPGFCIDAIRSDLQADHHRRASERYRKSNGSDWPGGLAEADKERNNRGENKYV